ncbi:MAG: CaiB/BaiF CoA-transferase family protein [Rhodocyclaceae bacterium]|jgi:crotonobetainyl-CoA:carnitine CoA-transferase CaiB-like acyl-CoA transferase|nr:CaiB/BaiF CoA-transferase family protein [Rhodocyclaceae bacterium]
MNRRPPLEGVRALDLTRLLPGPLATQHLADFGAEVIKVEDTGAGDYARTMGAGDAAGSFFYQIVNRNKKSLSLNLKSETGRSIFLRLVESADVVVEGFRPGVMDKLGLGYEVLAEHNPAVVLCSITGYGQTGPYAERAGHDINYIGYAGVLDQTGRAGQAPALSNLQIGDLLGGTMSAFSGILLALLDARLHGRGRHVDVSMSDAVLAHAIFPLTEVLAHGTVRPRGEDLLTGGVPCYGVYRTADDRFMAVGALEEKFWTLLCDTLDLPELKPAHLDQGETGQAARARLEACFASRTQAEWVALFDRVDCCVTPVLRTEESLRDPQFLARGMVQEVGGVRQIAAPFKMGPFAAAEATRAPEQGEHGREILRALGLDESYIDGLLQEGVIRL